MEGGIAALLGLARPAEYEPMTDEEHRAVAECYDELRLGHPGKHFTIQLFGTSEQTQVRLAFTSMGPQIVEELFACAKKHGLYVSIGADEIVRGGQVQGAAQMMIGPMAREKKHDELADTPHGVVH